MIDLEILAFLRFRSRVNFLPLKFVPYEQWLAFVRPDTLILGRDGNQKFKPFDLDYKSILEEGLDLWLGATYSIEAL